MSEKVNLNIQISRWLKDRMEAYHKKAGVPFVRQVEFALIEYFERKQLTEGGQE